MSYPFSSNIEQEFSNSFTHKASATSEGGSGGDSGGDTGGSGGDSGGDTGDSGDDGGGDADSDSRPEGDVPADMADQPETSFETTEPQFTSEICNNGADDDGDGKTDSADSDCGEIRGLNFGPPFGAAQYPGLDPSLPNSPPLATGAEESHESVCDDGIDNDGDGTTDKQDADCKGQTFPGGEKTGQPEDTGVLRQVPGGIGDVSEPPAAEDTGVLRQVPGGIGDVAPEERDVPLPPPSFDPTLPPDGTTPTPPTTTDGTTPTPPTTT
ncbi:MAG: hypothetical protein WAK50_17010, partial [Nitrososphaeraceae archaeon]